MTQFERLRYIEEGLSQYEYRNTGRGEGRNTKERGNAI